MTPTAAQKDAMQSRKDGDIDNITGSHELTREELLAKIHEQEEMLKAKIPEAETNQFRVSEKGAVSVYGLGRFPVTLYRTQWERLFGMIPHLQTFIETNADRLAVKPEPAPKEERAFSLSRTNVAQNQTAYNSLLEISKKRELNPIEQRKLSALEALLS